MQTQTQVYLGSVLRELPRLLSWQDREALSKTYGGFDRTYWGWKFTDFPGARFQEGVYALAHVYATPFDGNAYHQDPRVLEWALAGLRYWQSIQYADGSFDEAYPFERSLAATAFTVFYLGEACLLLGDAIPADQCVSLKKTFVRAGRWLCRNDEHHGILSNHLAAAAGALDVAGRFCCEDGFFTRRQHFLARIYAHQSKEGWYEEYGGADPGYQTHGTFYLARIWQRTKDAQLLDSLRRATVFLTHCIHPNGTLGGEYGSRNTEFYYPAGMEILAPEIPEAAAIARFMRPAVERQTVAGLAAMDAYNFLPVLNNYLFAGAVHVGASLATPAGAGERRPYTERETAQLLPCQRDGEYWFPDAGLFMKSTAAYFAVLGLSKGGVLRVYDRKGAWESDCGYWARLAGGAMASNQSLLREGFTREAPDTFCCETDFVRVNQKVQSPWTFLAFRLFSITAGRMRALAYAVKNLLVWVLVRRRRTVPLGFTRRVRFTESSVEIRDTIRKKSAVNVQELRREPKFASIHMGSSRYFQAQELQAQARAGENLAEQLGASGGFESTRQIVCPLSRG